MNKGKHRLLATALLLITCAATTVQPLSARDSLVRSLTSQLARQTTARVSVSSTGTQGNDTSGLINLRVVPGGLVETPLEVSSDGRFIAFLSDATNLVTDQSYYPPQLFLHDRHSNQTTLLVKRFDGQPLELGAASDPSFSTDDRFVSFRASASDVISDTNVLWTQVFLLDRSSNSVNLISRDHEGQPKIGGVRNPVLSGNGRYVAYISNTYYQPALVLQDIQSGTEITVSSPISNTDFSNLSISSDGTYLVFAAPSTLLPGSNTPPENNVSDVYLFNRATSTLKRISVSSNGVAGDSASYSPSISASGEYVAFISLATNLAPCNGTCWADLYLHEVATGKTERLVKGIDGLPANDSSSNPTLSDDGRFVAFISSASNLVQGDSNDCETLIGHCPDVFLLDRTTNMITRVSVSSGGAQSNGRNFSPQISGDGQAVVFTSRSDNLVNGDTNNVADVFTSIVDTSSTPPACSNNLSWRAKESSRYREHLMARGWRLGARQMRSDALVYGDTTLHGQTHAPHRVE